MGYTVTVTAPVVFKKWNAPNFATQDAAPGRRQDGMRELPSTPVAELPQGVLDALAAAWVGDVYAKAGKTPPQLVFAA